MITPISESIIIIIKCMSACIQRIQLPERFQNKKLNALLLSLDMSRNVSLVE